jgi:hypothetical protein
MPLWGEATDNALASTDFLMQPTFVRVRTGDICNSRNPNLDIDHQLGYGSGWPPVSATSHSNNPDVWDFCATK